MTTEQVFSQLSQMKRLKVEARCKGTPPTFSQQIGEGDVTLAESEGGIVFCERGIWNEPQNIRFTNVFRWRQNGKTISLEHLRFGSDKPVYLFDLSEVGEGLYKSVSPHACGEDSYTGILQTDGKTITLIWRIVGPKKNQEIIQRYS